MLTADDCIGPSVTAAAAQLKEGGVLLLENTRFHVEEEQNEPGFAAALVKDVRRANVDGHTKSPVTRY